MFAMEIEAERRREVIAGTKRDDGRGSLQEGRKRHASGTSDLSLAARQPRAREESITAHPALRG